MSAPLGSTMPKCSKCGKKKSYAVKRYYSKDQAVAQGFCGCVYEE